MGGFPLSLIVFGPLVPVMAHRQHFMPIFQLFLDNYFINHKLSEFTLSSEIFSCGPLQLQPSHLNWSVISICISSSFFSFIYLFFGFQAVRVKSHLSLWHKPCSPKLACISSTGGIVLDCVLSITIFLPIFSSLVRALSVLQQMLRPVVCLKQAKVFCDVSVQTLLHQAYTKKKSSCINHCQQLFLFMQFIFRRISECRLALHWTIILH